MNSNIETGVFQPVFKLPVKCFIFTFQATNQQSINLIKFIKMIVEQPKTLADFEKIKSDILDLMGNPYSDHLMFMSLSDKLENVNIKISELNRSYEEDFSHENGNYQNKCSVCGKMFIGHKRRTRCKLCVS